MALLFSGHHALLCAKMLHSAFLGKSSHRLWLQNYEPTAYLTKGPSSFFYIDYEDYWDYAPYTQICPKSTVVGGLGASWGLFWCLCGLSVAPWIFKTSFGGSLKPPSWPLRSLQQPQAAPQAPSWRGRWPHEATKAHLETYLDLFSDDFGPEIDEKRKQET